MYLYAPTNPKGDLRSPAHYLSHSADSHIQYLVEKEAMYPPEILIQADIERLDKSNNGNSQTSQAQQDKAERNASMNEQTSLPASSPSTDAAGNVDQPPTSSSDDCRFGTPCHALKRMGVMPAWMALATVLGGPVGLDQAAASSEDVEATKPEEKEHARADYEDVHNSLLAESFASGGGQGCAASAETLLGNIRKANAKVDYEDALNSLLAESLPRGQAYSSAKPTHEKSTSGSPKRLTAMKAMDWQPSCPYCGRANEYDHTMCDDVLPRVCEGGEHDDVEKSVAIEKESKDPPPRRTANRDAEADAMFFLSLFF